MSGPFPGMDPYLEAALWPEVHHRLGVRLDYARDPVPPLRPQDQQWAGALLRRAGLRGVGTLDGEG